MEHRIRRTRPYADASLGDIFSTGADKSALQATIYAALELDEEEYTKDSWQAFTEALVAAQAVLADEDATQDDVDAVLEALSAAMEGLLEAVIPL